jgi:hypothetical protein
MLLCNMLLVHAYISTLKITLIKGHGSKGNGSFHPFSAIAETNVTYQFSPVLPGKLASGGHVVANRGGTAN